jgi:hypothetical protein
VGIADAGPKQRTSDGDKEPSQSPEPVNPGMHSRVKVFFPERRLAKPFDRFHEASGVICLHEL